MFYAKCLVLDSVPYPEYFPIRGISTNRADLGDAEVVITIIRAGSRK